MIEFRVPVNDYAKRIEANIRPEHFKKNAEMRVLYSPEDYIPQVKQNSMRVVTREVVPRGCSKAGLLGCVTTTAVFKNTEKYCCSSPPFQLMSQRFSEMYSRKGQTRLKKVEIGRDGKIYVKRERIGTTACHLSCRHLLLVLCGGGRHNNNNE